VPVRLRKILSICHPYGLNLYSAAPFVLTP
jgi:hypothetical protein